MFKDWSKAAWNDAEQVAYDHGYIDGKMAGAEDLLAEKDERILDLEVEVDELNDEINDLRWRLEKAEREIEGMGE